MSRSDQCLWHGLDASVAIPFTAAAPLLVPADYAEIATLPRQSTGSLLSVRSARHSNPGEGCAMFIRCCADDVESHIYQAGDDLRAVPGSCCRVPANAMRGANS